MSDKIAVVGLLDGKRYLLVRTIIVPGTKDIYVTCGDELLPFDRHITRHEDSVHFHFKDKKKKDVLFNEKKLTICSDKIMKIDKIRTFESLLLLGLNLQFIKSHYREYKANLEENIFEVNLETYRFTQCCLNVGVFPLANRGLAEKDVIDVYKDILIGSYTNCDPCVLFSLRFSLQN
jgi:hypothetical protein